MTVLHPEWTTGRLEPPDWCPVPILQDRIEWSRFRDFVAAEAPAAVLEIGSFYGGTLWHWSRMRHVKRVVSVDLPVGETDSRHPQVIECRQLWPEWMVGIDFHDIVGNSTEQGIVGRVAELAPFDVAFVDGDHAAAVVRADWENYSSTVRSGGIVAFHDTAGIASIRDLVDELRVDHETVDFRCPSSDLGITAVFIP